jgi:lipid-A-disaccharide synthase
MRYYLIAGEASGDLHGSNLIKYLKQFDTHAVLRGWGGNLMQQQGMQLVKHYRELAFMGFWEVASNIRTILHRFSLAKNDILNFNPDVAILIDYPGFNLRLARFLKKQNIKVFYYISPQIWAWNRSRLKQIKENISRMFVILPFEQAFYASHGMSVDFVGHPLLDAISQTEKSELFLTKHQLEGKKIIALLPGSRRQEIAQILPEMSKASRHFPDYHFVVAGLSAHGTTFYRSLIQNDNTTIVIDETHDLLRHALAALVTSGTATLETALFNVPQAVCYKGSYISYLIGKMLVHVPYISLVNLILEKKSVAELIQHDCNEYQLATALRHLLTAEVRSRILADYRLMREKLGGPGASARAAKLMYDYLTKK